jgi:hypothetical protein
MALSSKAKPPPGTPGTVGTPIPHIGERRRKRVQVRGAFRAFRPFRLPLFTKTFIKIDWNASRNAAGTVERDARP